MKSRKQWPGRVTLGYIAVLATAFCLAMMAGWSSLADGMEGSAYDWMFRCSLRAGEASSVVLAIDEHTLSETGGMRNLRAHTRRHAAAASRKRSRRCRNRRYSGGCDRCEYGRRRSQKALADTPNLILGSDVIPGGEPLGGSAARVSKARESHRACSRFARSGQPKDCLWN